MDAYVLRRTVRGAFGFALGGIIAVVFDLLVLFGGPKSGAGLDLPCFLMPAGYFVGGFLGATILTWEKGKGSRGGLGFGVGFAIAMFAVFFTHISIQGGGKPEFGWGAMGCGIGFGIGGAIGGVSIRPILGVFGLIAFGIAGAVGGLISFQMIFRTGLPGMVIGVLTAFTLGGALFGFAVAAVGTDEWG